MKPVFNPKLFLLQNFKGTPIGNNIIELAEKNDIKGLENIARNLCAQRGLDYEKEMAEFRKKLGQ